MKFWPEFKEDEIFSPIYFIVPMFIGGIVAFVVGMPEILAISFILSLLILLVRLAE